jgi:hypothetical protein
MICGLHHSLTLRKGFLLLAAKTLWKCGEYNSSWKLWRFLGWVWEWSGVLGHLLKLNICLGETEILWIPGLVRTRRTMNARFLNFRCRFQANFYWRVSHINALWCFSSYYFQLKCSR